MARDHATHELGLFTATAARAQPRDRHGRFVQVKYSPGRLKVLEVAREMRVRLGLPPDPRLSPFERKNHD